MTTKPSRLRVATLAIGDELLDGRIADTNSQRLAEALFDVSLTIERAVVVSDDEAMITEAVRTLAQTYDVVVTSGGLGPTTDDITAEAIARAADCGLRLDEEALQEIEAWFEKRGLEMPENNRRQAEVPAKSRSIKNGAGISPAFVTDLGGAEIWSFPGVPSEYDFFVAEHLLPELSKRIGKDDRKRERRTLRCLGISESALGHALADFEAAHPELRVQYRTRFPENHVRLVSDVGGPALDALTAQARTAIGGAVYALGDDNLETLLVRELGAAKKTVAIAESCTGGLVMQRLTDVPGASAVFVGGVVAYANEVKVEALGVAEKTLETHGAVSEETAAAMAIGARSVLGADFGLSVTGIAGPGGGTDEKPIGTVCFGLASAAGVKTKRRLLPFPRRDWIRQLSASVLMRWLLKDLQASRGE